ncbi:HalOD1 output domain-containing protein [Halomontanus rarus]|uniref:HalOD1 output domain-containing protein n=1 Tax=Halomontanus rarus TaxID=3034020 RepID=UPI0023E8A3B9|nr:HalOD1 output domain-containing protein [Halovivax sp. TS33]
MVNKKPESTLLLEYEYDENIPASIAVIRAIATVEEVDPTTLSTNFNDTLFDRIDPGGFDALVTAGTTVDLVIEFTIFGYRVRIEDEARILIYRR